MRRVDRNGRVRAFDYDRDGRLVREIWYDTVADADSDLDRQNTITWKYDEPETCCRWWTITRRTVTGGVHFKSIPSGILVGTSGCGPCVGLILVGPPDNAGNRPIWVYHFGLEVDPRATLFRDGPFPKGSRAVIFGGDNRCPNSMGILSATVSYLHFNRHSITVDGLYNSAGMWVDANGNYHVHPRDRSIANNDGTWPEPTPPPDP